MVSLVPVSAFMTFFGPAIGIAVFNFGKFDADTASQLGSVLSWGAFTIIPYAMTLVQLRVFYAREDAWTPTYMVIGITAVKVAASYLGPVLFDNPDAIVRWLALSNGLGIGRAERGERVWKSVWRSGVAVTLKKKTIITQ